jgi:hypothetical protein
MATEFKRAQAALLANETELLMLTSSSSLEEEDEWITRCDKLLHTDLPARQVEGQTLAQRLSEEVLAPSGEMVPRYGAEMRTRVSEHLARVDLFANKAKSVLPEHREAVLNRRQQRDREAVARRDNEVQQRLAQEAERSKLDEAKTKRDKRQEEEDAAKRLTAIAEAARRVAQTERNPLRDEVSKVANMPKSSKQALEKARGRIRAIAEVKQIVSNICSKPENETFRTLRLGNPYVGRLIKEEDGVLEFLVAMGFAPVDLGGEEVAGGIAYRLVEPDLDKDFEAWSEWFDLIKHALQVLQA